MRCAGLKAPPLMLRLGRALKRGAGLALLCVAPALGAQTIEAARYGAPTDRYAHGVLGDAIEWGALELDLSDGSQRRFELPYELVFEDLAPRLYDLDQDGHPEVIAVLSHADKGAALAIYGSSGLITQTPHIGTRNRWLAPVGAGDLYGDGRQVIAYVDRPHLAKTLRFWAYQDGQLNQIDAVEGVSNHRIGEDFITGGIRSCAGWDEVIVADANWRWIVSVVPTDGNPVIRKLAPFAGPASVQAVMDCQ